MQNSLRDLATSYRVIPEMADADAALVSLERQGLCRAIVLLKEVGGWLSFVFLLLVSWMDGCLLYTSPSPRDRG